MPPFQEHTKIVKLLYFNVFEILLFAEPLGNFLRIEGEIQFVLSKA